MSKLFEDLITELDFDPSDVHEYLKKKGFGQKRPYYTPKSPEPEKSSLFSKLSSPSKKIPAYSNIRWVIPDVVIRSNRPGYPMNKLSKRDVKKWLKQVRRAVGVLPKAIILFLTNEELREFYNFDLLAFYKKLGFVVRHMPTEDPIYSIDRGPAFTFGELNLIKDWIEDLPKPVLIHCSAGIDRTGEVSQYLRFVYGEDIINQEVDDLEDIDDDEFDIDPLSPEEEKEAGQGQIDKFNSRYGNWKKFKFGNY